MLFEYFRVLTDISSTLTEVSLENQEEAATIALPLNTTDYLYLGQRFPFVNLFFELDTPNSVAASMVVEYWDGKEWQAAVNQLDGTTSGGVTLARTGNLKWTRNKDHSWLDVGDTTKRNAPSELAAMEIYDTYWMRLSPSVDISAGGLVIKEIGYAFTQDQELPHFDVEINDFLSAFNASKTDWIDQIKTASKLVVMDLRRRGLIIHQGQIIDLDDVYLPATLKTLELIYQHLGPSYNERRADIRAQYEQSLSMQRFTFDSDGNASIDKQEIAGTIKSMVR